ncbi:MAG: hypothetical protein LBK29_03000 [Oscillospiraceae bacterium]|jgi:hypothetical protein|nr:hypothetical protein [Oscillospiraceae bacterium]
MFRFFNPKLIGVLVFLSTISHSIPIILPESYSIYQNKPKINKLKNKNNKINDVDIKKIKEILKEELATYELGKAKTKNAGNFFKCVSSCFKFLEVIYACAGFYGVYVTLFNLVFRQNFVTRFKLPPPYDCFLSAIGCFVIGKFFDVIAYSYNSVYTFFHNRKLLKTIENGNVKE